MKLTNHQLIDIDESVRFLKGFNLALTKDLSGFEPQHAEYLREHKQAFVMGLALLMQIKREAYSSYGEGKDMPVSVIRFAAYRLLAKQLKRASWFVYANQNASIALFMLREGYVQMTHSQRTGGDFIALNWKRWCSVFDQLSNEVAETVGEELVQKLLYASSDAR